MSTELAKSNGASLGADIERVIVTGDVSQMNPSQRVEYYQFRCKELGLSIASRPFEYLNLSGKLVLYLNKGGAEQLRMVHGVSLTITETKKMDDIYIVTVSAEGRDGRKDGATGVITLGTLKGEALCNAMMKAETKAKRRATLSICGLLNMMDESEVDSVAGARKVTVTDDGEILEPPKVLNGDALLAALAEYYEEIDGAESVNVLKKIYVGAFERADLSPEVKGSIKQKCGEKRKMLEAGAA